MWLSRRLRLGVFCWPHEVGVCCFALYVVVWWRWFAEPGWRGRALEVWRVWPVNESPLILPEEAP